MKQTTDKIRLLAPSREMKKRVMAFRAEFFDNGEDKVQGSGGLHNFTDFSEWLKNVREVWRNPPPDWLPSTTYLAVRISDNVIVGAANVRHYLTERHFHNGHIGYSVRPSERRKGYGTEILRQALIKAEQLGILETAVTCDKENIGSKRVIENNGLAFEREYPEANGNIILIYRQRP